jgi:hypothetical protein
MCIDAAVIAVGMVIGYGVAAVAVVVYLFCRRNKK